MAKHVHGSVGEFNADREDWVSYIERLIQYFVANGISEEVELFFLVHVVLPLTN